MDDLLAQCASDAPMIGKAVLVIAALNALSHGLDWLSTKTAWTGDDKAAVALHRLVQGASWLVNFVIAKGVTADDRSKAAKASEDRIDRGA